MSLPSSSSTQEIAAIWVSAFPRLSSCWESSSCSLRIVWTLERKNPNDRNRSVAQISRNPSLCRWLRIHEPSLASRGSVATVRGLEFLGGLHAFADHLVLLVGGGGEAGDLQLLQGVRILEG